MRYVRFNRWIEETVFRSALNGQGLVERIGPPRVDLLVFEQAHHRGGAATEVAAGFSTRVLEFAARHGIEHGTVHTATLKKFVTGKGNAKKPEMVGAVRLRWAPSVTDDNEADAIAILYYALAELVAASPSAARRALA
jgi:Holliday junction resolvasome RuvABC endonuclease subunit